MKPVKRPRVASGAGRLLTKTEYARHRGVSGPMVTKWKNAGRLVMVGDRVDVSRTDALLNQLQDRASGGKGGGPGMEYARQSGGGARAAGGASPGQESEQTPAIVTATVEDKLASAGLKRARLDRELGRLVDRGAHDAGTEAAFALVRDGLANLHARIGADLATALGIDPRRVLPIVEREARRIANELAEAIEGTADQIGSTRQ